MSFLNSNILKIISCVAILVILFWSFRHQDVSNVFVGDNSAWILEKFTETITNIANLITIKFNF